MSIYQIQYEMLKEKYHEKIAPLYAICPWDDDFNDTIHGSRELDSLVADAMENASSADAEIIRAYNSAIATERKIATTISTIHESETLWQKKAEAGKVILEKTDAFVEVILAYYNKMKGQK